MADQATIRPFRTNGRWRRLAVSNALANPQLHLNYGRVKLLLSCRRTELMMTRIVIVSARVGAGHDGAAYALADRLTGHDVEVLDFLDFLPGALGRRLRDFYHRQLEVLPRSWDWTLT